MTNSLKKAYIQRNIIMLGSVLLLGLITIFNYNNYRYFVMGGSVPFCYSFYQYVCYKNIRVIFIIRRVDCMK